MSFAVDLLTPADTAGPAPEPARVLLGCLRLSGQDLLALCSHAGIDWERVAADAIAHRVVAPVLDALQACGAVAAGYVPDGVASRLRAQRRAQAMLALKLDAVLGAVLRAFEEAGIPVIVLKGLALARYYPSPPSRPRSDLDLLVDPAHWAGADRIITGLGFRLEEAEHVQRPLLCPLQAPEDRQYHRVRDDVMIELHADVLSTGLLRQEDAAIWERRQIVEIGGQRIPVLAPRDAFLQAATHMQRHEYTRLMWFYDMYLLLRAHGSEIDWEAVATQARQAGVLAAAYYAISYTEALFGRVAPVAARRALRPNAVQRRLQEGMWSRQRILSLDATVIPKLDAMDRAGLLPPATFDAYDPPKRMAAHLLLSGNVWPKLSCLVRRIVPTEDWLRYYGQNQRIRLYGVRIVAARLLDTLAK